MDLNREEDKDKRERECNRNFTKSENHCEVWLIIKLKNKSCEVEMVEMDQLLRGLLECILVLRK